MTAVQELDLVTDHCLWCGLPVEDDDLFCSDQCRWSDQVEQMYCDQAVLHPEFDRESFAYDYRQYVEQTRAYNEDREDTLDQLYEAYTTAVTFRKFQVVADEALDSLERWLKVVHFVTTHDPKIFFTPVINQGMVKALERMRCARIMPDGSVYTPPASVSNLHRYTVIDKITNGRPTA